MKKGLSFDLWMKIMGILLVIILTIYATIMIFECYWPKDELFKEFIIHMPEDDETSENDEIISFQKATAKEFKDAGFVEPTEEEIKEIIYHYNVDPPEKNKDSISA